MTLSDLISVARGAQPADLRLENARVVNVFNGEVEKTSLTIHGDYVAGIGDNNSARETIDLGGRYMVPGLIDGHVHLESSMLDVGEYARAVVPHGTAAIVTDLHEIANVSGLAGMRYVLNRARRLPLDLFLMAPSCVPATHMETSGAALSAADIRRVLRWRECIGLGEVMNFPGVIFGDPAVLDKVAAAQGMNVDGHAPGVCGAELNAYAAAGIYSDHESVAPDEGAEKLRRGMHLMIREGSTEHNLEALLPLVTDETYKRCLLVVDDRSAHDILRDGDIDAVVRKAIRLGLKPVRAIQLATINTAEYFRLRRHGAVAPGYYADFFITDDLEKLSPGEVYHHGKLVARDGKALFGAGRGGTALRDSVRVKPFGVEALRLAAKGGSVPVIKVVPGQIVTQRLDVTPTLADGAVSADVSRDLLKLAVVERHQASGNIGLGLIQGFGLKRGALASSVAHDSHNIVAVGTTDADLYAAIMAVAGMRGGLAAVADGKVIASLPLPVAGLLSDRPLETVVAAGEAVEAAARELGAAVPAPFGLLSFMALPVIPELRLTDRGLVDVTQFKLIED
jgi:adenine deaminase